MLEFVCANSSPRSWFVWHSYTGSLSFRRLARFMYASPAWWGFAGVQHRQKLEGFLRRSTWAGFCSTHSSNFTDFRLETDQNPFRKVLYNPEHCAAPPRLLSPVSASFTVIPLGHAPTTENSPIVCLTWKTAVCHLCRVWSGGRCEWDSAPNVSSFRIFCRRILILFLCTATHCYVLQLEMRVRLICVTKFYLLTYLLT